MTIRKLDHTNQTGGATGANQGSTTYYEGEIHDKHFTVLIDSMAAPSWGGEELDEDDRVDVLNAIDAEEYGR